MTEPAAGSESFETVRVSRVIPAPRAAVWRAWTDPAEKMRWWGRSEGLELRLCEIDLRVGGRYRYGMTPKGQPAGEIGEAAHGEYQVVEPEQRLVYTWTWGGEAPAVRDTLVTVTFEALSEDETRVTVVHERQPDARVAGIHRDGWTHKLADLALRYDRAGATPADR